MKRILALVMLISSALVAQESHTYTWTTCFQQKALYFSSDRVTMVGMGAGIGAQVVRDGWIVAQADVGILWGNGNAVPIRVAMGVQREGRWAPAVCASFNLLCGQRTEVLSETGQRPAVPGWAVGVLLAPLRFEVPWGYASALELGAGIGPDRGVNLELTILSVGTEW